MNPLIRYVDSLKAANTIPPSYEIRLLNGQDFQIYYEGDGLMAKIGPEEYYIDHYQEVNHAIKHINRLLTQPAMQQGDMDDEEAPAGGPPPPPKPKGGGKARLNVPKLPTGGAGGDIPDVPEPPPPPSPEPEDEA